MQCFPSILNAGLATLFGYRTSKRVGWVYGIIFSRIYLSTLFESTARGDSDNALAYLCLECPLFGGTIAMSFHSQVIKLCMYV